jgi:hypothetical protein
MVLVEITIIEKYEQQDIWERLEKRAIAFATKGNFFKRGNEIVITTGSITKDIPTFEGIALFSDVGEIGVIRTFSKNLNGKLWDDITNEMKFKLAEFL